MHTGHNGHEVSIRYFHGGIAGIAGRPTLGSWLVYGLGSESQELPAYMVLSDPGGRRSTARSTGQRLHAAAVSGNGAPRPGAADPQSRPAAAACAVCPSEQNLALLDRLNRRHLEQHPGEADLEARIASYELAAPMQSAAKEALDIAERDRRPRRLYGLDEDATREYGTRCLIARRLVERGVRFVQIFLGGQPGTHHTAIRQALPGVCRRTDSRRRPWSPISSSAACWTRRSSTGVARSAACRSAEGKLEPAPAATTTARASPSGWPAAASEAA